MTERESPRPPQQVRGEGSGTPLLEAINTALRERRILIGVPALLAAVAVSSSLVQTRQYRAAVSFIPDQPETAPGNLFGVAAQLGLSIPRGSGATESPQFYADLVQSREILTQIVTETFNLPVDGSESGTLLEFYDVVGRTPQERVHAAIREFNARMTVRTDLLTGVVRFTVSAPSPGLAEEIAARLLDLVNRFNLETRQSQAAAERKFIEERLLEVQEDLRRAEDELQTFLERNRLIEDSPQLRFERDRLERQVTMRQEVVTSLVQARERARMDEVRSTPVLTVIEGPAGSADRQARGTVVKGILALMVGFLLAAGFVFMRRWVTASWQEDPTRHREFRRLLRTTLGPLARLWPRRRGAVDEGA